jgi:SAM-dependent methyltransferase
MAQKSKVNPNPKKPPAEKKSRKAVVDEKKEPFDAWGAYPVWCRKVVARAKAEFDVGMLRVLKADANNEAYGDDSAKGFAIREILPHIVDMSEVSCVEINQVVVDKAQERFPGVDIQQGSITRLPYADESFHAVLDLSTIDHVPNYWTALDEYKRVLKPRGIALIVVWLNAYPYQEGEQLWFEGEEFWRALDYRFQFLEMESFDFVHGVKYLGALYKFVLRKK